MHKKSKLFNLSLLSLFFILSGFFVFAGQASAKPKIEFTETKFDLGEMYQNQEASHVFKFKNAGNETLKIDNVKGS
jgi:hypothetical protein